MGNIFLHTTQAIDLVREKLRAQVTELWKTEAITAFLMMVEIGPVEKIDVSIPKKRLPQES